MHSKGKNVRTLFLSPRLVAGAGVRISEDDCSDCSARFFSKKYDNYDLLLLLLTRNVGLDARG